jgi:ZIP family zinc transporter
MLFETNLTHNSVIPIKIFDYPAVYPMLSAVSIVAVFFLMIVSLNLRVCFKPCQMDPTGATVFGFSFLFLMTSLGSAIVFFFRGQINETLQAAVYGFAAGVMVSASFWGLLIPSVEEAKAQNLSYPSWIPCFVGFLLGCIFLQVLDIVVPMCVKQTPNADTASAPLNDEDEPTKKPSKERHARAFKLFVAIAIHNIPEGVACGLAFGHALKKEGEERTKAIGSAVGLAIGMGIQDIPEGAAVSLPIREMSGSVLRGFIYGVISGIVEPIMAGLALVISSFLEAIDPWALAFSGGAMIYVTVEELIPEAMASPRKWISVWSFITGFSLMMLGENLL